MDEAVTTDELLAIHLRFDPSTEALATRAIAELSAKLLFARGRLSSISIAELREALAKSFELPRVPMEQLQKALDFLGNQKSAREISGRWQLTEAAYEKISDERGRSETRLRSILGRHFPSAIDSNALQAWFNDACVRFYGLYGTRWAATIQRRADRAHVSHAMVKSLLNAATQRAGLLSLSDQLVDGFFAFIRSSENEDVQHQWYLGQSLLAAKLVSAKVGPDPITAEYFRGSLLLLDTNILLVSSLEAHRLAKPLAMLAGALKKLGVTLLVAEETRDEYGRVVQAKRQKAQRVVGAFSPSLLEGTSDAFVDTALERGCKTEADFEVFFNEIVDPPDSFVEGYPIALVEDPKVFEFAKMGREDEALKAQIAKFWSELRTRRQKGRRATEHDAALTTIAEGMTASGSPCSVLTLDRTMQEHSMKRVGPHGRPIWISLDALIQVLAADGHEHAGDPIGYAPLMATIIRQQCEPALNTYSIDDMALMLEIEERCVTLPEQEVREVVKFIAKRRLAGVRADDSELRLAIHKAFLSGREEAHVRLGAELLTKVEETKALHGELKEKVAAEKNARGRLVESRRKELAAALQRWFAIRLVGGVACVAAIGLLAWKFGARISEIFVPAPALDSDVVLGAIALGCGPAWWVVSKVIPEFARRRRTLSDDAERSVQDELGRSM